MPLRRKLLTIFAALAVMALLSGGLTIWSTLKQHTLLEELEKQYAQNLILQRIRTTTGTLFRRHAASIMLDRPEMSAHFEEQDGRIRRDLESWEKHVLHDDDRQRMLAVRRAYTIFADRLTRLLGTGGPVETRGEEVPGQDDFRAFRGLVDAALDTNQRARDGIHARWVRLQEAIQLAAAISAFGTLCFVLLLWAYVASDIFAPLRDLEEGLHAVARGDMQRRLDDERDDELGQVSRAFNCAVDGMAKLATSALPGPDGILPQVDRELHANLDRLESELRETAGDLAEAAGTAVSAAAARALTARVEELCAAVQRLTTFYLPAPLEIAPLEVGVLLYEAVATLHQELARRAVGVRLDVTPRLPPLLGDRVRLRDVFQNLLRDALDAMLGHGSYFELRAGLAPDNAERVLLELAAHRAQDAEVFGELPAEDGKLPWSSTSMGVIVARRVVEQHGGTLTLHTAPDGHRSVWIGLPLIEPSGESPWTAAHADIDTSV